jgi:preprotein translocase subunit SecD
LEEIGQKVAEARALVAQRNRTTDGNRVKEIDNRLNELGFANPVATTEAQRRGLEEPLGLTCELWFGVSFPSEI